MPNAEAFLFTLLWDSVLLSLGVLLAVLLGKPLHRLGGTGVLPARWLLVLVLPLALRLPALELGFLQLPVVSIASRVAPAHGATATALWPSVALGLWLAVALALAAWQWRRYRRLAVSLRPSGDGTRTLRAPAGSNPALIGLWRPQVALPIDFEARFTPAERRLILSHEEAHRGRGDNWINLLALAVCLLHWFNPLLWWAFGRLQRDEELACDALVLRRAAAGDWQAYAQALLKVQDRFAPPVPLAVGWRPTHPLVERITMLKHTAQRQASPQRRWAAQALLIGSVLLSATCVSALQASPGNGTLAADAQSAPLMRAGLVCKDMKLPELVNDAPKGVHRLIARFSVDPSGKVRDIQIEGSPELQPTIREAIGHYGCSPGKTLRRVQQEFSFKLD